MSGFRIEGDTSTHVAEVNSNHELLTALTLDETASGFVSVACQRDAGDVSGTSYTLPIDASEDWRIRVGMDTFLDNVVFNYSGQDTARHRYDNTTMTATWGSGFLAFNSGSITTANTGATISTYKVFPVFGATDLYVEMSGEFSTAWKATNTTTDFGLFLKGASTPYAPTDGIYFRATSAGMFGVVNNNGVETVTPAAFTVAGGAEWIPSLDVVYKFTLVINAKLVSFWIDDVLVGKIDTPAGNAQPILGGSLPLSVRQAIGVSNASAAQQFKLSEYTVSLADVLTSKPWHHQMCGMGQMAYQAQAGATAGSTAAIANGTNPTPGAGSNTTANVAGLGGLGAFSTSAGAVTDFIATSYQNPAAAVGQTGKNLYITGVSISAINTGAAVATSATSLYWYLAFGHTNVSLATTEAANAKAPRRVGIGFMSALTGAAIGQTYTPTPLTMKFDSPIVVNPGEFVASVCKFYTGTATTSQVTVFSVTFDGYFE
jgi:hypothetical protein